MVFWLEGCSGAGSSWGRWSAPPLEPFPAGGKPPMRPQRSLKYCCSADGVWRKQTGGGAGGGAVVEVVL